MGGFKDVIGHNNIIQYIGNVVTSGKVSHAYILNGERGSGKKLLAELFAMSLQKENTDADLVSSSKRLEVEGGWYYRVRCIHAADGDMSSSATDGLYVEVP